MKMLSVVSRTAKLFASAPLMAVGCIAVATLLLPSTAHAGIRVGEYANCAASTQDLYHAIVTALAAVVGFGTALWLAWSVVATLLSGGQLWPALAAALARCGWRAAMAAWSVYQVVRSWIQARQSC